MYVNYIWILLHFNSHDIAVSKHFSLMMLRVMGLW